jgi:hypothetical protein
LKGLKKPFAAPSTKVGCGPFVTVIVKGSGPNAAVAKTRQEGRIPAIRCNRELDAAYSGSGPPKGGYNTFPFCTAAVRKKTMLTADGISHDSPNAVFKLRARISILRSAFAGTSFGPINPLGTGSSFLHWEHSSSSSDE